MIMREMRRQKCHGVCSNIYHYHYYYLLSLTIQEPVLGIFDDINNVHDLIVCCRLVSRNLQGSDEKFTTDFLQDMLPIRQKCD